MYSKENYKEFEGRSILELAAGCGSGSLPLAKYNIKHLTLTDFSPKLVGVIKENIELNKSIINAEITDAFQLDYGKESSFNDLFSKTDVKYDTFIACDPMWDDDQVKAFIKGMEILFNKFKGSLMILVGIHFLPYEKLDDFLEENEVRFEVRKESAMKYTKDEHYKNVVLYFIKEKDG